MKEWRARDGGHGADGKFRGRNDGARESIREDDGDGAAERGGRQQNAMIGAEDEAHDVGHEQADVADCAADGNGQRR